MIQLGDVILLSFSNSLFSLLGWRSSRIYFTTSLPFGVWKRKRVHCARGREKTEMPCKDRRGAFPLDFSSRSSLCFHAAKLFDLSTSAPLESAAMNFTFVFYPLSSPFIFLYLPNKNEPSLKGRRAESLFCTGSPNRSHRYDDQNKYLSQRCSALLYFFMLGFLTAV